MSESSENSELPKLPVRPRAGHKGTFGTVAVFGGSIADGKAMIGAPALAARAALRAGAGLARLVCPSPVLAHAVALCPSATGVALSTDENGEIIAHDAAETFDRVAAESTCVAIGPGLGVNTGTKALTLRAVQQEDVPVVVDADALTCLAQIPELTRDLRAACVLTPHPGEFRRLADALNITESATDPALRPAAAEKLAQRLGCIVVLKGAGTVVTDGQDTWVSGSGHPCMATAGTGDVLTGLLAGLLAQHGRSPGRGLRVQDIVRIGVEAHARAGEAWAASRAASGGLLAEELADLLPGVLETMRDPG